MPNNQPTTQPVSPPLQINPQLIKVSSSRRSRKYLQPETLKLPENPINNISTKQTVSSDSPQHCYTLQSEIQRKQQQENEEEDHQKERVAEGEGIQEIRFSRNYKGEDEDIVEQQKIQKRKIQVEGDRDYRKKIISKYDFEISESQSQQSQQSQQQKIQQQEQLQQSQDQSIQEQHYTQNPPKKTQQHQYESQKIQSTSRSQAPQNTLLKITNISKSLKQPFPQGYRATFIVQVKSVLMGLQNIYYLYANDEKIGKKKCIISAKKGILSWNPCYIISGSEDNHSVRSQGFMGMLSGNFYGNQWELYDHPKPQSSHRLLQTHYSSSLLGSSSTRNMQVLKPNPQKTHPKKQITLNTVAPTLNSHGKYRLDFRGKAKQPSTKNFMLDFRKNKLDQKASECLLFAKQKQNEYVMQIGYPLSVLEGFALCLTSLHGKMMVN